MCNQQTLYCSLDCRAAVQARVDALHRMAEDAAASLRNELKVQLVKIPKQVSTPAASLLCHLCRTLVSAQRELASSDMQLHNSVHETPGVWSTWGADWVCCPLGQPHCTQRLICVQHGLGLG